MKYEKEHLTKIVRLSSTLSDVARNLKIEPSKGNRDTIKKYINLYKLDISHFKYIAGNNSNFIKVELSDILVENSTFSRTHLKERLYKEGLKERKCELCDQGEEWQGKTMSLILDHKNGIGDDNRLDNLRIVCPNCNSTLDTNCSKNKTKYRSYITNIKHNCIDCGVSVTKQSNRCRGCDQVKQRKVKRPLYSELIKEVEKFGYRYAGRKYDVCDNTIKKWIKNYDKVEN